MPAPTSGARPDRSFALLALIVLAGGLLRLCGLGDRCYWSDELWVVKVAGQLDADGFTTLVGSANTPLYFLLMRGILAFSSQEWATRILSALTGTAGRARGWLVLRYFYNEEERKALRRALLDRHRVLTADRFLENQSVIPQLTGDTTRPPSYFALEVYLLELTSDSLPSAKSTGASPE